MPAKPPPVPISFAIFRDDEPVIATLEFAGNADIMSATRWHVPSELDDDPLMRARAADACEFALLAAKRWRHYRDTSSVALTLGELKRMISSNPAGEFCFHLKMTADWFPGSLGSAMVRRPWRHNLMIDFLFVHPRISGRVLNVKGVGIQILKAICAIAYELGCDTVWGEATQDSAPFYERHLHREVGDRFDIGGSQIIQFATLLEAERSAATACEKP